MTPRWKIRRGWKWFEPTDLTTPCWHVYPPGDHIPVVSFNVWENAVLYVELVAS